MTKISFNSRRTSSPKRIAALAGSLVVVLAAVGSLLISQSATTLSSAMRWALNVSAMAPAVPLQSTEITVYLHGSGSTNNPTLFLDATAPVATIAKSKDSSGVSRSGGNPWKEVGTWNAPSVNATGTLTSLSDLHVWLGLKNSDDQGANFDLRAEAYRNDTLVASGQSLCITGITRNAANAKEVVVPFDPFSPVAFNGSSDVWKLKILTRVGTNQDGSSCGGHSNAVGLRLYFDAVTRSARFNATTQGASDTTPPVVTIDQPSENSVTTAAQVNISGTFTDASPTTITVNGVAATINGTTFSATVALNEGVNGLSVVAVDAAGNQTTASRNITRDTIQPAIVVLFPADGAATSNTEIDVAGTVTDATATTVTVNNVQTPLSGNNFSRVVQLSEGANVLRVKAIDAAGNQSESVINAILDTVAPTLTLTEPAVDQVSGTATVNIRGTVTDRDLALVAVMANDQRLIVGADGTFTGSVDLPEGSQSIKIVATDAGGNQRELVRAVTIDLSRPEISNLTPVDGTVIDATTTITGQVTDSTAVVVKVNNVTATVAAGGTFTSQTLAMAEGQNQITVSARDAAGNETSTTLSLIGRDRTPPAPPTLLPITSPTRLAFQTIEGTAESGAHVSITGGVQPQTADAAFGTGIFVMNVNLAPGANVLTITATDADGNTSQPVQISITSDPQLAPPPAGTASQINISTGNGQNGLVGMELPRPLIAIVTDRNGAVVQGAAVQFTVEHGGGSFVGGGPTITATTDALGHASVRYVAGPTVGLQQVRANFNGNTLTPAIFLAESLQPVAGSVTTVTGAVLDQNLRALPNVLVRLGGQQTRTGPDGLFLLSNVAAGPHQLLELIGRDQVSLPGRWPNITYDFDVLPGVNNDLGRPLFLPKVNDGIALPLDANNVVTQDTVFELPVVGGEPPIRVTAKAGTRITFPPDVTDKRLSVTRIPTNRVPMVLEDGRATNLYISVQPSGAIFEQPLEISFPNLDRLAANIAVLLMSFDHDAGRYVKVGTGHVSGDARVVTSDPGSGIRVGAWHGVPPDPPQPEVTVLGYVQVEGNPALDGKEITSRQAWVDGQPAERISSPTNLEGVITRDYYRAVLTLPREAPPRLAKLEAHYQAAKQTITLSPNRVFLAPEQKIDVTATLSLPVTGTPKFTWKSSDTDKVTVAFAANNTDASTPNVVTITSGKREKAGTTKVTVEYKSSTGVKAKAELEVTLVRVDFEQISDCSGFDDTKVNIPGTQNNEPFWLTVVLNGTATAPQPGTTAAEARARITPSSAAAQVTFEVVDPTKATVSPAAATTSPQTISVLGRAHGETQLRALVNNEEAGILGIAVRRRIIINVSLHYMSDNAGHHTNRDPAGAAALIAALNAILTKQTGIEYRVEDTFTYTNPAHNHIVPRDLGPVVNKNTEWADIVAFRDTNRTDPLGFNQDFYFVWDLENGDTPVTQGNRVLAAAGTPGSDALIDDTATAQSMAHEVLHFFGITPRTPYPGQSNHSATTRELLYPLENQAGCLIPKRDIDQVHNALP